MEFLKKLFGLEKYPYTAQSGKIYQISKKRYELIQKADNGDEEAQYILATEYYETTYADDNKFIPEICFKWAKFIADKEKDLGIMLELTDLYYEGSGTEKNIPEALRIAERMKKLYISKPDNVYIPNNDEFENEIDLRIKKYSNI